MMKSSISQTLLTGVYRTGSEYLSKLLNHHPEISSSEYQINLMRFIYDLYNPIQKENNLNRCLSDLNKRLTERYGKSVDADFVKQVFYENDKQDYGSLYDILMSYLHLDEPVDRWVEKNQLLWREIPEFLRIMPNGKSIVILRDPRSVLVSFKSYTYTKPPAYLGAIFNCYDCMQAVLKYTEDLPPDMFRFVKYEELAANPLQEVNKLFNYLEVEPLDELPLQNLRDAYGNEWNANSAFHENKAMNEEEIRNAIHRWENRINPAELSLVEGVCGELMGEFGYKTKLKEIDWPGALRMFLGVDEQVTGYFTDWLQDGRGIESFPTDPLKSENWEENQKLSE